MSGTPFLILLPKVTLSFKEFCKFISPRLKALQCCKRLQFLHGALSFKVVS